MSPADSATCHSMTQAIASAWEPTPWRAVQIAAWEALGSRAGLSVGDLDNANSALRQEGLKSQVYGSGTALAVQNDFGKWPTSRHQHTLGGERLCDIW